MDGRLTGKKQLAAKRGGAARFPTPRFVQEMAAAPNGVSPSEFLVPAIRRLLTTTCNARSSVSFCVIRDRNSCLEITATLWSLCCQFDRNDTGPSIEGMIFFWIHNAMIPYLR